MDLQEKQKELSMATGGRMFLMLGGIMLLFTALTNTAQYGIQMFRIAAEAAKGTDEYVELLETLQMSGTALRVMGAAFLVTALVELTVSIWCIRSSNRLDKSRGTLRAVLVLLAVEIVMQAYLLITGMNGVGAAISAVLMPVILLWGVTRLRKLAKLHPDQVYAVEKSKNQPQTSQPPKREKSLRERAMMNTGAAEMDADDEEETGTEAERMPDADTEQDAVVCAVGEESADTGTVRAPAPDDENTASQM